MGKIDLKNITRAHHILNITLVEFAVEDYLLISCKYFTSTTGSVCNSSIL